MGRNYIAERTFGRERARFGDFVRTRTSKVHEIEGEADDHELLGADERIKARAALAGYVLRRWNVDASPDHRLDPATHHLWLRNTRTLYGVESAAVAPGVYVGAGKEVVV